MRSPFFSSGRAVTANTCSVTPAKFVQLVFNLDVRHHLAADLAEAR